MWHFRSAVCSATRVEIVMKEEGTSDMRLVIEYPKLLPDALQRTRAEFEQEARMAMAVKLFEMKRLSSGIAAKLAGTDRVSFLLSLHRYGVAMIDLDEDELLSDVKNA
jgi:predicted HTH domain antitoxin